jgi:hypothetical protein
MGGARSLRFHKLEPPSKIQLGHDIRVVSKLVDWFVMKGVSILVTIATNQ